MFNSQFQIPIRKRLSGSTVRVRFRECKRRHSTIHLRSATGGLPGLRSPPLDSPGFFSTIPNSADRFFVILLKLTLKAGGRASPTSNSIHGAIDGCVLNCEIPRRHWRGSVGDSNGVECNGIPIGHYIGCSKLPPEQMVRKSSQLFPDLHHLAAFSVFEVQRIDEFLSLLVF